MTEQRYTHVSRRELRSTLSTRLGFDPKGDSADQIAPQLNAFIHAAALRATEQFQFLSARKEFMFDSETEQGSISMPPGCGPGSIIQVSIWIPDDVRSEQGSKIQWLGLYPPNVFVPLERKFFANDYDSNPLWEEGGVDGAIDRVKGIPKVWAPRGFSILIRPITDRPYRMKVLFTYTPELKCDDDKTTVDGELIIRYAMVEYFRYAEEMGNADRAEKQAEDRVRFLRGQQVSSEIRRMQKDVNLRLSPDEEAYRLGPADLPRFDYSLEGQNWPASSIVNNPRENG